LGILEHEIVSELYTILAMITTCHNSN